MCYVEMFVVHIRRKHYIRWMMPVQTLLHVAELFEAEAFNQRGEFAVYSLSCSVHQLLMVTDVSGAVKQMAAR